MLSHHSSHLPYMCLFEYLVLPSHDVSAVKGQKEDT